MKGTRIGLCLPNTPYFVVMYNAILKAGGAVVNFNPLYTEREIEAQARQAGVKIMVSLDVLAIHTKIETLATKGVFTHVIVCSMAAALPAPKRALFRLARRAEIAKIPAGAPYTTFKSLTAGREQPAFVAIDPGRDIAALQFTGGTTGTPKAAMLTHANITANVRQIRQSSPALTEGQERIVGVLPFFHVFAMTTVMNLGLAIGAELLLLPRPDMPQLLKLLTARRPTMLPGVPTLFTGLTAAAQAAGITDFSYLKFCISGGAPIAAETANRFERLSGCRILEGYGLSETSPVVTFTPPEGVKRGSVGRALPGTTIEIRDPKPRTDSCGKASAAKSASAAHRSCSATTSAPPTQPPSLPMARSAPATSATWTATTTFSSSTVSKISSSAAATTSTPASSRKPPTSTPTSKTPSPSASPTPTAANPPNSS